ncbi:MAG: hypothetical protein V4468_03450 [Pseudomonadota bacterium]
MSAEDKFKYHTQQLDSPSRDFAVVVKSDTVDFDVLPRAIYVGTGGDIQAVREDGVVVPFLNYPGGQYLPIRCIRINATGTTAGNFVRL